MIANIVENKIKNRYILLAFLGLMLLVIGKDVLHSFLENYHFYISESLLFSTFWLVFVPLILVNRKFVAKLDLRSAVFLPFIFSLLHSASFSLIAFAVSGTFFDHTFEFFQLFIQTISENSIFCILIYGITSLIFYKGKKQLEQPELHKIPEKIAVTYHSRTIILNCTDILYVKSETPYISIVTKERIYLQNDTLKRFLAEKVTNKFIQVHKSTLINTEHITSYTSHKNGDYDITLLNEHTVRASRSFNKHFKPYFDSIG